MLVGACCGSCRAAQRREGAPAAAAASQRARRAQITRARARKLRIVTTTGQTGSPAHHEQGGRRRREQKNLSPDFLRFGACVWRVRYRHFFSGAEIRPGRQATAGRRITAAARRDGVRSAAVCEGKERAPPSSLSIVSSMSSGLAWGPVRAVSTDLPRKQVHTWGQLLPRLLRTLRRAVGRVWRAPAATSGSGSCRGCCRHRASAPAAGDVRRKC